MADEFIGARAGNLYIRITDACVVAANERLADDFYQIGKTIIRLLRQDFVCAIAVSTCHRASENAPQARILLALDLADLAKPEAESIDAIGKWQVNPGLHGLRHRDGDGAGLRAALRVRQRLDQRQRLASGRCPRSLHDVAGDDGVAPVEVAVIVEPGVRPEMVPVHSTFAVAVVGVAVSVLSVAALTHGTSPSLANVNCDVTFAPSVAPAANWSA